MRERYNIDPNSPQMQIAPEQVAKSKARGTTDALAKTLNTMNGNGESSTTFSPEKEKLPHKTENIEIQNQIEQKKQEQNEGESTKEEKNSESGKESGKETLRERIQKKLKHFSPHRFLFGSEKRLHFGNWIKKRKEKLKTEGKDYFGITDGMESIQQNCEHTKDTNVFVQKGGIFPFTLLGRFGPILGYYKSYRSKRSPKMKFRQNKKDPFYETNIAYHEQVHSAFVNTVEEIKKRKHVKQRLQIPNENITTEILEKYMYDPEGESYYDYKANDEKEKAYDNIQKVFSFLKGSIKKNKKLKKDIERSMERYLRKKVGWRKARKYISSPPSWYRKRNFHEFFTCTFTDPKFQFFLKSIAYEWEEDGKKREENMFSYLLKESNKLLGSEAVKKMDFSDYLDYAKKNNDVPFRIKQKTE